MGWAPDWQPSLGSREGSRPALPPLPVYRGAEMPGMPHVLPDSLLSARLGLQSRASCCTCVLHVLKPQPGAPVTPKHGRPWLWDLGSQASAYSWAPLVP